MSLNLRDSISEDLFASWQRGHDSRSFFSMKLTISKLLSPDSESTHLLISSMKELQTSALELLNLARKTSVTGSLAKPDSLRSYSKVPELYGIKP